MTYGSKTQFRINFWGDRALYRNTLHLSRKQAIAALIYSLAGSFAGFLMVVMPVRVLVQDLRDDGPFLIVALCLPFGIGILMLIIGVRIAFNSMRRLLSGQQPTR